MAAYRDRRLHSSPQGGYKYLILGCHPSYHSLGVGSDSFQPSELLQLFQYVPNPKCPGVPTALHTHRHTRESPHASSQPLTGFLARVAGTGMWLSRPFLFSLLL